MAEREILNIWIAKTKAEISALNACLDLAAGCGDEEGGQELGIRRAKFMVELACLFAARQSAAGNTAQVRYFPDCSTIALTVGEDVIMFVERVPEALGSLLTRHAGKGLTALGYQLRRNLVVRESHHPDSFVPHRWDGAASLPN